MNSDLSWLLTRKTSKKASVVISSSYVNFIEDSILFSKYLSPLAYSKKTVAAIMMLYRNMKVKVSSPDADTDYFDIVSCVLQGDTSASNLFIIGLDYVLRTSVDKIKANKGNKPNVPQTNNYGCRLYRWYNACGKYTRPSRNPAT